MKPRKDRTARLMSQAEVGHRLARFVADEAFMDIFADLENAAIEAMIAATTPADREREALRIQVIRAFLAELQSKAAQGQRAEADLRKPSEVAAHA